MLAAERLVGAQRQGRWRSGARRPRHRVARVQAEVQQHLFELRAVGGDDAGARPRARARSRSRLGQQAAQERKQLAAESVEVHRLRRRAAPCARRRAVAGSSRRPRSVARSMSSRALPSAGVAPRALARARRWRAARPAAGCRSRARRRSSCGRASPASAVEQLRLELLALGDVARDARRCARPRR